MKLLGLGDNVFDSYDFRGEIYPGGNSANVAVLSKRAGADVSGYLGILANDRLGMHFADTLKEEKIDTERLRFGVGDSACNHIVLDEDGDRKFAGNNGEETVQSLMALSLVSKDFEYAAGFDVIHSSIHSLINGYIPRLAQKSDVSMDFSNDGFTKVNIGELAPFLRFVFLSSGGRDFDAMEDILSYTVSLGIPEVICTMGSKGSCGYSKGQFWQTGIVPNENVIDGLGAGDAFIASFLVNFYKNGGNAEQSAKEAAAFASTCMSHYGAFGHPLSVQD